jgi:hypothetical protein
MRGAITKRYVQENLHFKREDQFRLPCTGHSDYVLAPWESSDPNPGSSSVKEIFNWLLDCSAI